MRIASLRRTTPSQFVSPSTVFEGLGFGFVVVVVFFVVVVDFLVVVVVFFISLITLFCSGVGLTQLFVQLSL